MTAIDAAASRYRSDLLSSGWWHSIDLGHGQVTNGVNRLEDLQTAYRRFNLPEDLGGKRVLDVGCWDGFYAFEAERHGAEVVAVDCFRPETFFFAREALKSQAQFHELSVYELAPEQIGQFDFVFFLGVLYHLQHPLLGLQRICEVTKDVAVIGSFITDSVLKSEQPAMIFYPLNELGGQYDNWCGPNSECLVQMTKAAGFVRTEWIYHDQTSAVIKAFRHWQHPSLDSAPSLVVREVANSVLPGRKLVRRGRFALLSLWIEGLPEDAGLQDVRVEVGGYATAPVYIEPLVRVKAGEPIRINRLTPARLEIDPAIMSAAQKYSQVIVPVPPGLKAGRAAVQVYCGSRWSDEFVIELSDNSQW
ncbi:MAG: DUF1698 domain-containing protein [Blastocatellia bacterium]